MDDMTTGSAEASGGAGPAQANWERKYGGAQIALSKLHVREFEPRLPLHHSSSG